MCALLFRFVLRLSRLVRPHPLPLYVLFLCPQRARVLFSLSGVVSYHIYFTASLSGSPPFFLSLVISSHVASHSPHHNSCLFFTCSHLSEYPSRIRPCITGHSTFSDALTLIAFSHFDVVVNRTKAGSLMQSLSTVLALTVVATALFLSVNGQCDPTVCCDPSVYQTIPSSSSSSSSLSASTEEDDPGIFQSFSSQLNILAVPIQYDPTVEMSFNTMYNGTLIDKNGGSGELVQMKVSITLPNQYNFGVQLSLSVGDRFNQTSPVYTIDESAQTGFIQIVNNPPSNPNLPAGLLVLFETDIGNDERVLASHIVPQDLVDGQISASTVIQSLEGPLSSKSCLSLPVWQAFSAFNGEVWWDIQIFTTTKAIFPQFAPRNRPHAFCNILATTTDEIDGAPALNFSWTQIVPESQSRDAPLVDVISP